MGIINRVLKYAYKRKYLTDRLETVLYNLLEAIRVSPILKDIH